jgi:hypothetical protein
MNETENENESILDQDAASTEAATAESQQDQTPQPPQSPLHPDPDPLTTADLEMTEEEKVWRANGAEHFRLNRKHKPAVTEERIAELEGRVTEVTNIIGEIQKLHGEISKQNAIIADQGRTVEQEEDARGATLLHEAEIKMLEEKLPRRALKPYDQVVVRLHRQFGLLSETDRQALRAAEAKRKRQAEHRNELGRRGAFVASEKAAAQAKERGWDKIPEKATQTPAEPASA